MCGLFGWDDVGRVQQMHGVVLIFIFYDFSGVAGWGLSRCSQIGNGDTGRGLDFISEGTVWRSSVRPVAVGSGPV